MGKTKRLKLEEQQPGLNRDPSTSSIETISKTGEKQKREQNEEAREKAYQRNFEDRLEVSQIHPGTVGRRTRLVTNCFHIGLHGKQIHYYEVLIRIKQKDGSILAPKTLRLKRGIFWSFMIANATEKFGIELYQVVFDDERALFTTVQLGGCDWKPGESYEFDYLYDGVRGRFDTMIMITFKQTVDLGDNTLNFVCSPLVQYISSNVITQYRRIPENLVEARQWFAKGSEIINLSGGYRPLEVDLISRLFQGISVKVKSGIDGRCYLNIGLIHRVLVQTCLPLIQAYSLLREGRIFTDSQLDALSEGEISFDADQVGEFNAYFSGIEVKTTYEPIRHYTIDSLATGDSESTHFIDSNDVKRSVREYYHVKYGIRLRFPRMQLLKMRTSSKEVYIPMEVCEVSLKPQRVHKKLNSSVLRNICRAATMDPRAYFSKISEMGNEALFKDDDTMNLMTTFGVDVESDRNEFIPIKVDARVLPAPKCRFECPNPLNEEVVRHAPDSYLVACAANMRSCPSLGEFVGKLVDVAHMMDVRFINARDVRRVSKTFESLEDVRRFIDKESQSSHVDRKKHEVLFLFILGENAGSLYSWIKTCGDVERGVQTQCVNGAEMEKKFDRRNTNRADQFFKNLVAKINTRLGGVMNEISEDRRTSNPCNEVFSRYTTDSEPTLFLGVFHRRSVLNKQETTVSMSFNRNARASKFSGIYGFAERDTDFLTGLDKRFYDVLSTFQKRIGKMPSRVLILRGGLGDSIAEYVAEYEVIEFRKAWERFRCRHSDVKCSETPSILYLTVERNHKVRFMKESEDRDPGSRGNSLNMEKGTVIDGSFINSPRGNGFYLCSHKGILGTSKPAYYEIRFNEWNVEPEKLSDVLQPIIFSLCYMLQRSVQTPSSPAPVYYARLLSDRVAEYLKVVDSTSDLYPHRNVQHSTYFT